MKHVLHSFAYGLDFLREQVVDVASADWAAQPRGTGDAPLVINHPAWVVGHLTYTCQLLGGVIGVAPWLPEDWVRRFGPGSVPVPGTSAYGTKEDALAVLSDAQERIARAVLQVDEARLDEPFPDEAYRDVFPTIRHALTQVLVGHVAYHVGQVTVWRRAMGLPPVKRSFE